MPLDIETLAESVGRTGRAVVINEAPRTGGFAGEIVAQLQERVLYDLLAPIQRVTGWDTVFPLKRGEHHYLPSVAAITAAAHKALA